MIDTSAIVAILQNEPERSRFDRLIAADPTRLMSAVSRVECTCVIEGRKGEGGRHDLKRLVTTAGMDTVPVDHQQVDLACDAFRRFGKGRHPAALNIGDCFAYALAKASGEPLLFKGDDFGRTDVLAAT